MSDLAPTLLELVGVDPLLDRNGVAVKPMTGHSMAPTLRDPAAPAQRTEAVYEMIGHRGFYRDGWEVVTLHRPWTAFDDSEWELYDLTTDRDRAARPGRRPTPGSWPSWPRPGRRRPGTPRSSRSTRAPGSSTCCARRAPNGSGSPCTIWPGTPTLERWRSAQLIWLRSFRVTAPITVGPDDRGTIVAHGDQSGGYGLYVLDGRMPTLALNDGRGHMTVVQGDPLTLGDHELVVDFDAYERNRWRLSLTVDGEPRGERPEVDMMYGMAPFEGISVGRDPRSPVWWDRHLTDGSFAWTGAQGAVTYTPGDPAPGMPDDVIGLLRKMGASFE